MKTKTEFVVPTYKKHPNYTYIVHTRLLHILHLCISIHEKVVEVNLKNWMGGAVAMWFPINIAGGRYRVSLHYIENQCRVAGMG